MSICDTVTVPDAAARPASVVLDIVRSPFEKTSQLAASPRLAQPPVCAGARTAAAATTADSAAAIAHARMPASLRTVRGTADHPRGVRSILDPRPASHSGSGSGGLGRAAGRLFGRLGDQRRLDAALDGLLGHDALLDVAPGGQLELHLQEDLLDDRAQAAGAGLALERAVGHGAQRVLGEHELDPVEAEEALELLDDRVARLGEDGDQVLARELVHRGGDRQAADELRDQPVLHEVLGEAALEQLAHVAVGARLDVRAEADALVADPALDDLVQVGERPAADEQDVRGVD